MNSMNGNQEKKNIEGEPSDIDSIHSKDELVEELVDIEEKLISDALNLIEQGLSLVDTQDYDEAIDILQQALGLYDQIGRINEMNLIRKKIPINELAELLEYGKGELETYDEETDEVSVSFGDTNLPYLWSVEGVARLIKGLIGKQKGIPEIEIFKKSDYILNVDKNIRKIRPFISAFIAKGCKVNDYMIKQMIDLQEKFCEFLIALKKIT